VVDPLLQQLTKSTTEIARTVTHTGAVLRSTRGAKTVLRRTIGVVRATGLEFVGIERHNASWTTEMERMCWVEGVYCNRGRRDQVARLLFIFVSLDWHSSPFRDYTSACQCQVEGEDGKRRGTYGGKW
jgi:hypothetical protein